MADLYRIVYTSRQQIQGTEEERASSIATILSSGRLHNRLTDLTSVLALHRGRFAQVIEGDRRAAEATFARIRHDSRHRDVDLLASGPVRRRDFPHCSLALIGHSVPGRDRLDELARRTGSDLGRAEPSALVEAFAEVLARESPAPLSARQAGGSRTVVAADERTAGVLAAGPDPLAERDALDALFATAVFSADRRLLRANGRFAALLGYGQDELAGFDLDALVHGEDRRELDELWAAMARGIPRTLDHRAIGRAGVEVRLRGIFRPRLDAAGALRDVVEIGTELGDAPCREAGDRQEVAAIGTSQAVVHFSLDGIVEDANALFLDAMGYGRDEIVGRHHRMFVEPGFAHSADYARFWRDLGRGQHHSGQFRRFGRDGREVWLQATYNPILDGDGRPLKVVKYATVITDEKIVQAEHQGQIAAVHKIQCVVAFDVHGTVLDANDNFLSLTGYRLADLRGRPHRIFLDPEEARGAAYAAFWAGLRDGRPQQGEYKRLGRDGRDIWLRATYHPILDTNGRPFKVVEYALDVTADKVQRAEFEGQIAAIRKSQGVMTFDMAGTIVDANDLILASYGYGRDALLGRHHSILLDPEHAASPDYAAFWATLRAGIFLSGLHQRRSKDGRPVWIQASYNPIPDLNGRPFKVIKIASDVTSQVALAEAYEDAKRQALHDSTTALPNRTRLTAFMSSALASPGGRLVVLYMDLDRFKPVNDALGHAAGDRVLGEVADRLRRCLSDDQLAARVGGDEFVVVAPDLPDDEIEPLCQSLIDAVSAPILHEGAELAVGLSIGVAVAPADGTSPDQLLRCADAALCRAKRDGRGTFDFYAATRHTILAYRDLVDDMRRGLAADEFFLEYQPRFDPRDLRLRSVEALVRWRHPERGRIAPADFIPMAEKSGLIVPLGAFVLRAACRAAALWERIGVSVNVSPVQFRNGDLVPTVTAALAEAGLDPRRLEIEITEGVLFADAELAGTALKALKATGVRIAMDDFGTGYSSLSSLRSFPFDVIKIDRHFVADMDAREGGREVVQAILGLGRALGLSVTAEGVETPTQLMMLTLDGCQEVQGYLLARPMAAEDITARLTGFGASAGPDRLSLEQGRR